MPVSMAATSHPVPCAGGAGEKGVEHTTPPSCIDRTLGAQLLKLLQVLQIAHSGEARGITAKEQGGACSPVSMSHTHIGVCGLDTAEHTHQD